MTRKLTTEEFVAKAREAHGDKYGYENVEYQGNKTPVKITCTVHGAFMQRPNNHMRGEGCDQCSGKAKLTTSLFIAKAKAVHSDKYRYGKVKYVNQRSPVIITCREHGDFSQIAQVHMGGSGCPACGGPLQLDTTEFLKRARARHGHRYDYSKAIYTTGASKVIIGCREHGDFQQAAREHICGQGCPVCAGTQRHTKASFVKAARGLHGNRYRYSKVAYVNNRKLVTLTCPTHGDYQQVAGEHLQGYGCPKCGGTQRLTTELFKERAAVTHNDFYDYGEVVYTNNKTKVTITCPKHGEFAQAPADHLAGQQCPHCAGQVPIDTALFIERCLKVHGARYGYEKVDCKGKDSKVTIYCTDHGDFKQIAAGHMRGAGCPHCAGVAPLTTRTFIARARKVHGDRYSYDKLQYVNNKSKVTITCSEHGDFQQQPANHISLQATGCPSCAVSGYKTNQPGTLYYLRVTTSKQVLYKIGITNFADPLGRWPNRADRQKIAVLKKWRYQDGAMPLRREQKIMRQFAEYAYTGRSVLKSGNTELFTLDVLGLDRSGE